MVASEVRNLAQRSAAAAKEIKTGTRVGLNWPLEQMDFAGEEFRQVLKHEIYELGKNMNVRVWTICSPPMVLTGTKDDRLTFNTQTSSQWDVSNNK